MSTSISVENLKSNFNINTDLKDVTFRSLKAGTYNPLQRNHQFGEKISLLYEIELTVFNIEVILKVLAFKYESHAEVLKLEIRICDELLAKEMASCKNFLQRKRNLNLVFEVVIKFARFFEMRRLICRTVFEKHANVITTNEDNKINVRFYNNDLSTKYLEFNWIIMWNVEQYEVSDFVEFYFNYSALNDEQGARTKQHLAALVEPDLNFHSKLKLWRSVIDEIYGCTSNSGTNASDESDDVLEIVDSDSDDNDVIEINRNIYDKHKNDEVLVID